ncbi:MAG: leucine-rich repeat domain-containing protein [Bacteroidaceae bacterium]|nr:leucine-rich repeat domain-containing protein [Bacteroidaceae bacterium]
MATIAENLQTIKDSTEAIKQAIIDKGGTISGGLTTYADAIKNISGGGGGTTVDNGLNMTGEVFVDTNCGIQNIKHITVTEGVEILSADNMGIGAFEDLSKLESVDLPQSLVEIQLCSFYCCDNIRSIIIPDNVIRIGREAFYRTSSLEYVVMPANLRELSGEGVFEASSIQFCYFNNCVSIPNLDGGGWSPVDNAFPEQCKIIVPDSLYEQWKTSTNWSVFASQIYKASEYPIPNN